MGNRGDSKFFSEQNQENTYENWCKAKEKKPERKMGRNSSGREMLRCSPRSFLCVNPEGCTGGKVMPQPHFLSVNNPGDITSNCTQPNTDSVLNDGSYSKGHARIHPSQLLKFNARSTSGLPASDPRVSDSNELPSVLRHTATEKPCVHTDRF